MPDATDAFTGLSGFILPGMNRNTPELVDIGVTDWWDATAQPALSTLTWVAPTTTDPLTFEAVPLTFPPPVHGGTVQLWTTTHTTTSTSTTTITYTTSTYTTTSTTSTTPYPVAPAGIASWLAQDGVENNIKAFLVHTKFWPKYNDENLISHADDQIRQQYVDTTSLSELVASPPHESTGHPIGAGIESYQGFQTVEIWIRQVHLGFPDDDGNCNVTPIGYDPDTGLGSGTGQWETLLEPAEQDIEKVKILEWRTVGSSTYELHFIFRSKRGGYVNLGLDETGTGAGMLRQYVHVAWHDSCSTGSEWSS